MLHEAKLEEYKAEQEAKRQAAKSIFPKLILSAVVLSILIYFLIFFIYKNKSFETNTNNNTSNFLALKTDVIDKNHLSEEQLKIKFKEIIPDMIPIKGNSFIMGCKDGRDNVDGLEKCGEKNYEDELPHHEVMIKNFEIAKYELTIEKWNYCVSEGFCEDIKSSRAVKEGDLYPVYNVSWVDAKKYLSWLNNKTGLIFRLPTESEWEYVARAESNTAYSWGNTVSRDYANYGSDDKNKPNLRLNGKDVWEFLAPVGSLLPNKYGIYDMNGNVSEWVEDSFHKNYIDAPLDGSVWRVFDEKEKIKIVRGGSWYTSPPKTRTANRFYKNAKLFAPEIGFRIARDISESTLNKSKLEKNDFHPNSINYFDRLEELVNDFNAEYDLLSARSDLSDESKKLFCEKYSSIAEKQIIIYFNNKACKEKIFFSDRWSDNTKIHYPWCSENTILASSLEVKIRQARLKECIFEKSVILTLSECKSDLFHKRVARGDLVSTKFCIESGININFQEKNLWTALHSAAFNGQFDLVKFLVAKGASKDLKEINGRTAKDLAIDAGHQEIADFLD